MQIILFLVFILVIILVIVAKNDSLSKGTKIYIAISAIVILGAMYFYESSKTKSGQYNRQIVNAFKQGKTLTCKEYKVNKQSFIYVSGTSTFIPKEKNNELQGAIIEVSTCSTGQ